MTVLNVLLVGAGRAGMVHARNFSVGVPGARLIGVADPDPAARQAAVAELACDLALEDPLSAVTRDDVDAVIVAGPTFTHAEVVLQALAAGKHVLSEKPIASSMTEAHAIERAAATADGAFLMAFMRRFDRRLERAAERIAGGDIGTPLHVRSMTRGPGLPPRWAWDVEKSGGLISEVNSHDIDTIRWMSGQEPVRAYARGIAGKRPDLAAEFPGFIDTVTGVLELSEGAIAQFDGACPADYGYDARVEIYGTEGTILVGGPNQDTAVLVRKGGSVTDPVASWRDLFADAYRREDAHFVRVARGDEAPKTTAQDGTATLATALASIRSVATGVPVDVDLDEGR